MHVHGLLEGTQNLRNFTGLLFVTPSEVFSPLLFRSPDGPAFAGSADDTRPSVRKALRVLIADDHEAVRRGLKSAVMGAGWVVCGEATNGKEAIDLARDLGPDIIVLDISMPVMGGLEAAPFILRAAPKAKVVAFTMHESQQIKNEVARIGVHALAVKSAPLSELLQTIRSVIES
jgi:CheY-like chemotaxis protein